MTELVWADRRPVIAKDWLISSREDAENEGKNMHVIELGFGKTCDPNPTQLSPCKTLDRYMLCHQEWHYRQVPPPGLGQVLARYGARNPTLGRQTQHSFKAIICHIRGNEYVGTLGSQHQSHSDDQTNPCLPPTLQDNRYRQSASWGSEKSSTHCGWMLDHF